MLKRHILVTEEKIAHYFSAPSTEVVFARSVGERQPNGDRLVGRISTSAGEFRRMARMACEDQMISAVISKTRDQYDKVASGSAPPPAPEDDAFFEFRSALISREAWMRDFPFRMDDDEIAMIVLWMAWEIIDKSVRV